MTALKDRTIGDFLKEIGPSNPTPGGGSVAALSGAMGAALRLPKGTEREREDRAVTLQAAAQRDELRKVEAEGARLLEDVRQGVAKMLLG